MSSSDNERVENQKYKSFILSLIQKDKDLFCGLRKEKQLDYLFPHIKKDIQEGSSRLLDLCCGYGRLIYYLEKEFPKLTIHGVDYLENLIAQATEQFKNNSQISFSVVDAYDLSKKYSKEFDLTIIHKTLSWLPYYENILREAFLVTKKKIYITSLFWDGDIDFITKIFNNASVTKIENFSYINTYSYAKFKQFCLENGARDIHYENMHIDVDLLKPSNVDQLQTHTVRTLENNRLEFTGPLQLNWKLIEIQL